MIPYIIYFFSIFILSLFCFTGSREIRLSSIGIILIIIALFSGFRDGVGVDTSAYIYIYDQIRDYGTTSFAVEKGFLYLNKFVLLFSQNVHIFFFLVFCITLFFTQKFLHYFVPEKYIGFCFLVFISSSFYFVYALSGIRQGIAIGIVLYSFKYIVERKALRFFVLSLLAVCFHFSAVIVFPFYFIPRKLVPFNWFFLLLLICLIAGRYVKFLFYMLVSNIGGHYAVYADLFSDFANSSTGIGIIGRIVLWVMIAYCFKKYAVHDIKNIILYNIFCSGVLLYVLFLNVDILVRLSEYFTATFIAILPLSIRGLKITTNRYCYMLLLLIMVCCLYFSAIYFEIDSFIPYKSAL